jgi:hypothetical protein
MLRIRELICQQTKQLLSSHRRALLCALMFLFVPYLTWISSAVIALVTLRKGVREGLLILIPVVFVYGAWSMTTLPFTLSVINTGLTFVPLYIAACILYLTSSWQIVTSVFALQIVLIMLFLQCLLPGFIQSHFVFVMNIVQHAEYNNALTSYFGNMSEDLQHVFVNYVLGVQAVSVVIYAMLSLLAARCLQSLVFYPEGFKQELLSFNLHRLSCAFLAVVLFAAAQKHAIAINVLPVVLFFFMLSGVSFCASVLEKRKIKKSGIVLILPLLALPFVMCPMYMFLGFLDGLFNFRSRAAHV